METGIKRAAKAYSSELDQTDERGVVGSHLATICPHERRRGELIQHVVGEP